MVKKPSDIEPVSIEGGDTLSSQLASAIIEGKLKFAENFAFSLISEGVILPITINQLGITADGSLMPLLNSNNIKYVAALGKAQVDPASLAEVIGDDALTLLAVAAKECNKAHQSGVAIG